MARQHPGEITGSYMIEGAIDFLLGNSREAEFLRENCVFKIFPMINVIFFEKLFKPSLKSFNFFIQI